MGAQWCMFTSLDNQEDIPDTGYFYRSVLRRYDFDSKQLTGLLHIGAEPDGVAVTPDYRKLYQVCSASNELYVIDLASWKVQSVLALEPQQWGYWAEDIAMAPDGLHLYLTMFSFITAKPAPHGAFGPSGWTDVQSSKFIVIDTGTDQIVGSADIDPGGEGVAAHPTRPLAYCVSQFGGGVADPATGGHKGAIQVIDVSDPARPQVTARYTLQGTVRNPQIARQDAPNFTNEVHELAIDPAGEYLYCCGMQSHNLARVNAATGEVDIYNFNLPFGHDDIAMAADGSILFLSCATPLPYTPVVWPGGLDEIPPDWQPILLDAGTTGPSGVGVTPDVGHVVYSGDNGQANIVQVDAIYSHIGTVDVDGVNYQVASPPIDRIDTGGHSDHIAFAGAPVSVQWADRPYAGWPAGRSALLLPARLLTGDPAPRRGALPPPAARPVGELPLAFRLEGGRVPAGPVHLSLQRLEGGAATTVPVTYDPADGLHRAQVDASALSPGTYRVGVHLADRGRHYAYLRLAERPAGA